MADVFAKSGALHSLLQRLAEQRDWPLKDRLALVQRLARQVQTLHQNGRIHRAISIDAVTVDERLQPQMPPPAGVRRFGGEDSDPEFCPPELTGGQGVDLPEQIDSAAKKLAEAGYRLDPRRIDVYQLGVLLCRLATGEPVLSYIYNPTIKGRVPAIARPLLEGALGFDTPERFENCDALIAALDEALRRTELLEAPTSAQETPAPGSIIAIDGDTPPQGTPRASQPHAAEGLPFQRLGHYRIVEQIGSGGMGDVYRAYDESLQRQVAVKVLPAQLARDADFVRRFHAEAAAAASLSHPNVVPIYFIGEDAGCHFFAMQYVDGESLAERLAWQGRLSVDGAVELITQCLAGLQAAHQRGLIHRDVKPANILLDRQTGRAMLVDFGLVRRINESARMTATGVIMGTVDYIAPEQARGGKIDARTDIYSLGVLFYQLLSGRLPFLAESPTAMIFQHAYEKPCPLDEAAPGLPPPVVQIVQRMMAKDPDHRYTDCAAALADIHSFRQDRPPASPEWPTEFDKPDELPEAAALPAELARLLDPGGGRGIRDWAATIFRRYAPPYVQELRGTTQQMDAAVAEYERRRNRLAKLSAEARALEAELSQQLAANVEAAAAAEAQVESAASEAEQDAAAAKRLECEAHAETLRPQLEEQRRQVEELDRRLNEADATLARLRSQQGILKARLEAAEGQRRIAAGLPRPARRPLTLAAAAFFSAAAVAVLYVLARSGGRPAATPVSPTPIIAPLPLSPPPERIAEPFVDAVDASAAAGLPVVVEGVGWGGFRVGATREALIEAFGPLEPTPETQRTGWVSRHHIDCWFDSAGRVVEVRFVEGFKLPLASGIRIGSSESAVLSAYGAPDSVVNNPQAKMLRYYKHGVLMWLMDGKVISFTVFRRHGADAPAAKATFARWPEFARDAKLNEAQRQFRDMCEQVVHLELYPISQSQLQALTPQERTAEEERWRSELATRAGRERDSAINALALLGSKKAVAELLETATQRSQVDNRPRWMAVRALGIVGDPIAVPDLVHLTYHYNQDTRLWAQISLVRLTGENFARDVAAWRQWWDRQGGKPPISEEIIDWQAAESAAASQPDSAQPNSRRDAAGLEGDWDVALPAGFKHGLSILHLDAARYRMSEAGVFSGVYELRGDKLAVVEPDDKRLTEFVWQMEDSNRLLLIESSHKTGQDYRGAVLVRVSPAAQSIAPLPLSSPPVVAKPAGESSAVVAVEATFGNKFFRQGDSISITEVKATSPDLKPGDKVIVKGRYTLSSAPEASLCLFLTAAKGPGRSRIHPEQRLKIAKGEGEFELSETLQYDGYLHVAFYAAPQGKPFGGMYFGTAKQMKEIMHWDVQSWYTAQ